MIVRIAFYLLGSLVLMLLSDSDVVACSCRTPVYGESQAHRVRKERNEADAVFTGKVVKIVENREEEYTSIELIVIDVWKGGVTGKVLLETGLHDGNCRFPFAVGETYLVYAGGLGKYVNSYSFTKTLSTGICSRTALLTDAKGDIRLLGKRTNPRRN